MRYTDDGREYARQEKKSDDSRVLTISKSLKLEEFDAQDGLRWRSMIAVPGPHVIFEQITLNYAHIPHQIQLAK